MRDTPDQYDRLDRAAQAALRAAHAAVSDEEAPIGDSALLNAAIVILEIALAAAGDLSSAAVNELLAAHRVPWRLVRTH